MKKIYRYNLEVTLYKPLSYDRGSINFRKGDYQKINIDSDLPRKYEALKGFMKGFLMVCAFAFGLSLFNILKAL